MTQDTTSPPPAADTAPFGNDGGLQANANADADAHSNADPVAKAVTIDVEGKEVAGTEVSVEGDGEGGDLNEQFADDKKPPGEEVMTETHIQANKEAALFEKWAPCLFMTSILVCVGGGMGLLAATLEWERDLDKFFWINKICTLAVISALQFAAGFSTLHLGVKVNYTRKFLHFNYFAWPIIMEKFIFEFESTIITGLWQVWLILFGLLFISEPMVERFWFFRILYAAIDRPEDRPYTRLWFISQLCVSLPVIATFHVWMSDLDEDNLVFIPIIILALGDGLAEPVGVRFGKHKYKVPRLCGRDRYYRSWEGSSMVFLVSVVACAAHYNRFSTTSMFIWSICILPFLMTWVEAWAPHTWDNPLLLACGYLVLVSGHYAFGE